MHLHFVITGPGSVGYLKTDKRATLGAVRGSDHSGVSTRTGPTLSHQGSTGTEIERLRKQP